MQKQLNGSPIIQAAELPIQGMKMRMEIKRGALIIEFSKNVSWLSFNKADAIAFARGLAQHIVMMDG